MGVFNGGSVGSNHVMLSGVLSIAQNGSPRIVLVNENEYNRFKFTKDVVYVVCRDKNDITTLIEVYCNGVLVATTVLDFQLYIGILPCIIF